VPPHRSVRVGAGAGVGDDAPCAHTQIERQQIGVCVTPTWVMLPRKSLSMVLGIGMRMVEAGKTCDYCTLRETCRYQDHYA